MPRSLKLPKPKSPPGMKIGPDGAQQSIATDPTVEQKLPKMGAGGETVTVSFPNYETVDWSSRPAKVAQGGWYKAMRRAALATGGVIQYDEPSIEFVTISFGSAALATKFCNRLVQENDMDPKQIDATVKTKSKGAAMTSDKANLRTGAAMTKQPFVAIADSLRQIPDSEQRNAAANAMADTFAKSNPRFDRQRFLDAVNGGGAAAAPKAQPRKRPLQDAAAAEWSQNQLNDDKKTTGSRLAYFRTHTAVKVAAVPVVHPLRVDLTRYVVTASGHVVFAEGPPDFDKPEVDESMESEADPHGDVAAEQAGPKPGDEVLVISLDAAQTGTLRDSGDEDGTVVVDLEGDEGPIETEKGAIRLLHTATVSFSRMPQHLRGRGLPVRLGKVAMTLHRVVTADQVEVMTEHGPRRIEASRLLCPIKIANIGTIGDLARDLEQQDFMSVLRAAGEGRTDSMDPASGIRFR